MQDLQQTIDMVGDYIRGIWIKKRFVIISSWLICPIGFAYVAMMPDVYESEAIVYVDTRSLLQPLLKGLAIQTNPQQEIQMMAKTLLSRSNVETIARESDLDITVTTDADYNELITELSGKIDLKSTRRDNIYTISYKNQNASMAKTVVQETLDLFVEGSLGNNRRDSDTAGRFLDEQISEYETRLSESEQRLADFKRQYSDILPLEGTFYDFLQKEKAQLEATELLIRQIQEQSKALKSRLTSRPDSTDGFGVTNEEAPVLRTRYDERIRNLEGTLDQLRLRFTERHPDVIETQTLLDNLTRARQSEVENFLNQDIDGGNGSFSQLNREIQLETSRLDSQIASQKERVKSHKEKISELNTKIDLVPQIEAEFTALNRDYGITKEKYEELLGRKESADLSRRADVSSEELQFRIIEPPLVADKPTGPARIIFYIGVLIAGFGSGIAVAFLISQLSPILVHANQLSARMSFPILGLVTHLDIQQIRKRNRNRILLFALSSGAIVVMFGILVTAEIMSINLVQRVLS
jgi:polysaccharide chain length determinant protein (PEP-CTERM system associated)